jgi:hypothetical protein
VLPHSLHLGFRALCLRHTVPLLVIAMTGLRLSDVVAGSDSFQNTRTAALATVVKASPNASSALSNASARYSSVVFVFA